MLRANKIATVVTIILTYYVLSVGALVLEQRTRLDRFATLIFAMPAPYLADLLKALLISFGM